MRTVIWTQNFKSVQSYMVAHTRTVPTRTHAYTHMQKCTYAYAHARTHTHTHMHICTHTYIHTHTNLHTQTHMHAHKNIHTKYTPPPAWQQASLLGCHSARKGVNVGRCACVTSRVADNELRRKNGTIQRH